MVMGSLVVSGVLARPVKAAGPIPCSTCTEFTLPSTTSPPTSGPQNIAVGADGNIWFTIQNSNQIGRINPSSDLPAVWNVPTTNSQPNGIALGPDGNIWFTEYNAGKIGEITPSGSFSEYPLPTGGTTSGPRNIALGPGGTMWFTEYNANKIGEIVVSEAVAGTSAGISEYPVAANSNPRGIIEGPDGNIWFTEYTADEVGYLNPASPTTPPVLFSGLTLNSGPRSIDVGPNGYLWFTENNAAKVGKILAAAPNTLTEYPTTTPASVPARMTEGPDGNMWFSENGVSQIGSINPTSGAITEYTIPTAHSNPVGVITGPDHNIWFTENGTDKIGQLGVVLPTTTALGSSTNPSLYGNSITLTATVSPQAVAGTVPDPASVTGTVTFFDGGTAIGTGTVSSDTATLTTSALSAGSHSLTAVYNGDSFNTTSTSTPLTQVVQGATTTGVASNDNPATYGDAVTFTATVLPSTATGNVTFLDGTTSLGTATLGAGGTATLTTSSLTPGSHSITATYGGDTLDAGSTSSSISQQVNQLTTTTGLVSDNNPSVNGQAVDFTASVLPATATGTVTFSDGGTTLGTQPLTSGSATLTTSSLSAGTHSIIATYNGDVDDAASVSPAVSQVVNPGNTTTALVSSENPSNYGDSVTFTATVSPGTATGTVTFVDGTTDLGTVAVTSGSAALTTSALTGGTHNVTAVYSGDLNNDGSSSNTVAQVVNQLTTTTGLESSANPSNYGDPVTFTATVSPGAATGTVTFLDGTTVLGTSAVTSGSATLTTSALTGGPAHDITAVYSGDLNYEGSTSNTVVQVVNPLATTTGLASNDNPSASGDLVTFTATVLPSAATGTVTFYDGGTSLGTGTLSGGIATLATSSLSVGSHSITAVYGSDTNDLGSTSSVLTQVVLTVSATGLGSSENPSQFGDSVTLTATVTPGSTTGAVTFYDGSTNIGSDALIGGTASLVTSTLALGGHDITAVYGGDVADTGSTSAVLTQVVNQATSATAILSSLNPSIQGESVTFTANVTPSSATGTVTFRDGTLPVDTEILASGTASFTTSTLAAGSHSITALYSGDTNDAGSTSPVVTQVVVGTTTTTTVASSENPAPVGQNVTFTATVTPSLATGTVTFKAGATVLGTATLSSGIAFFSTSSLAHGNHQIRADYAGDGTFSASRSAKLVQVEFLTPTTTTVASSANPSAVGESVTFTATVTPSSATGTVTLQDGTTVLGTATLSGGVATFTTSSLALGAHKISAIYGGDFTFKKSKSAKLAQSVQALVPTQGPRFIAASTFHLIGRRTDGEGSF
jgi:streptogramin lyase